MMKKMTIGTYYPVPTYLHNLDPRVKVLGTLFLMVLLFLLTSMYLYGVIFFLLLGVILTSKLPLGAFTSILRLSRFLVLVFLVSLFIVPGESILFSLGNVVATVEGALAGILLMGRLVLILTASTILMLTTPPLVLTRGIEKLLFPLKKMGMPVTEGVLMLNLAMRFVPTLLEEKTRIISAQKARGSTVEEGKLIERLKNVVPIMIPLILSALKRADDLALAMDARNFKIGQKRTHFKQLTFTLKDVFIIIGMLFICFAIARFDAYLQNR